ncbi:hypothetical protein Anapl_05907 [Anas platyrhynchos]|uniref:Uncharacterized protein n=1 Tax=Anas platyrhynchos TaxID=8839 RepID=R0LK28_ANAPL|nr:hypothetical protein Anapl_05907 [Anas platyrhynchos]
MVKIPLDLVTDQRVSELNKSSHKEEQQRGLAFFGFGFNFSPSPSHNIPSYDCPLPLLPPMLFHASLWPTLAAPPTPSSIPSSRAPRTQVLAPRPVWSLADGLEATEQAVLPFDVSHHHLVEAFQFTTHKSRASERRADTLNRNNWVKWEFTGSSQNITNSYLSGVINVKLYSSQQGLHEGTLSTIHATCHHYSTIPEQFQLLQQRKAELGIVTLEEHLNLEKEKHILQITPMFSMRGAHKSFVCQQPGQQRREKGFLKQLLTRCAQEGAQRPYVIALEKNDFPAVTSAKCCNIYLKYELQEFSSPNFPLNQKRSDVMSLYYDRAKRLGQYKESKAKKAVEGSYRQNPIPFRRGDEVVGAVEVSEPQCFYKIDFCDSYHLIMERSGNDGKEGNKKNQILYSEIQSKTTYTDEANRPESLGKRHSSDCPTSGSEIQNDSTALRQPRYMLALIISRICTFKPLPWSVSQSFVLGYTWSVIQIFKNSD